jgi:hypothetical protein
MNELTAYLDSIIERWRRDNVPIRFGVDAASIASFESQYRVTLPHDMKEFFLTVDGMGDHYDEDLFFRFWPLEQVQPINQYHPELKNRHPEWEDYFLFFDHSIDLFMYAIHLQQNENAATPVARLYPQDAGNFQINFESFTDLIVSYAVNPENLF